VVLADKCAHSIFVEIGWSMKKLFFCVFKLFLGVLIGWASVAHANELECRKAISICLAPTACPAWVKDPNNLCWKNQCQFTSSLTWGDGKEGEPVNFGDVYVSSRSNPFEKDLRSNDWRITDCESLNSSNAIVSKASQERGIAVSQATTATQVQQSQADRAFSGKKRVNIQNDVASDCIADPVLGQSAQANSCETKVNYGFCVLRNTRVANVDGPRCENQQFGVGSVSGRTRVQLFAFGDLGQIIACKDPSKPYDLEFKDGQILGRCAKF
jgi:hypothetical protein